MVTVTPSCDRRSLDDAMAEHMASLVLLEKRSFSYLDFLQFEVNGVKYSMSHGTFRNKICNLRKKGEVEVSYRSVQTFYTIKGHKFGKPMTPNHTGIVPPNNPLFHYLSTLPYGRNGVHDIRLRFTIKGLWLLLYRQTIATSRLRINYRSKDIRIEALQLEDLFINVVVHKPDTVTVNIGCSYEPVVADIRGVIVLSNALTRIEERLCTVIREACVPRSLDPRNFAVPAHGKWLVTMWHFGRDSMAECGGRDFHMTWAGAENTLVRVYTKIMKEGKRRIPLERQEYPDKTFDVLQDKLCIQSGEN